MDINQIEERLKRWKAVHDNLMGPLNTLMGLTDSSPECKLLFPIFKLWYAYTDSIEEILGDSDGWLEWYEIECGMGQRSKMVWIDGKEINVKTLHQLAKVITWDGEK